MRQNGVESTELYAETANNDRRCDSPALSSIVIRNILSHYIYTKTQIELYFLPYFAFLSFISLVCLVYDETVHHCWHIQRVLMVDRIYQV